MAHQSLYRRHRPQRFAGLVGQEHVSTALCNAVREERVGHAYLFSGPRGTGKTTTARLLAKALNCLNLGADGEPCGECENCEAITTGTFYDLAELDAASNNGVDAIRDLVQSVGLGLGATSRHKVYIIDEVHMLSAAASNALLKTLEEPPEHVVFVLATTDPGKVLPTIRSRTQHFEFTLLTHDQLVGLLTDVLEREGVEPDDDVLDVVVRRAAGSARDALSLLDQALALGEDRHLDAARVRDALGDTPFERRVVILDAVAQEDGAGALLGLAATLGDGIAPRQVADDLLRTLRDAFVLDAGGGRVPHDGPAEEAERLVSLAAALGRPLLTRGIETLGRAIVDIRGSAVPDPRLVLEVAILRLTRRDTGGGDSLRDRVEALERQVAELRSAGGEPARPGPASRPGTTSPSRPSSASAPVPSPSSDPPVDGGAAGTSEGTTAAGRPAGGPRRALGAFRDDHTATPAPRAAADAAAPASAQSAGVESDAGTAQADHGETADDSVRRFDIDDVIEAWPEAMGTLSPPLRAAIQDAQPIAVEGGVIVFGVPHRRLDAIRNRFRTEADTIRSALAQHLGSPPQFKLRGHDFAASDALLPTSVGAEISAPAPRGGSGGAGGRSGGPRGRSRAGGTGGSGGQDARDASAGREDLSEGDDVGGDQVNLSELVDAPADAAMFEPTAMLQAELGAQIVEERPREQ